MGKMAELNSAIDRLYDIGKARGFMNSTLTAASLNRIRQYGDEIFDAAETLSLMVDPKTEEKFRIAAAELESGDCLGMEIFS